jgi:hypothetical protein
LTLEENDNGSYFLIMNSDEIQGPITVTFHVYDGSDNYSNTDKIEFDVSEEKDDFNLIWFLLPIIPVLLIILLLIRSYDIISRIMVYFNIEK